MNRIAVFLVLIGTSLFAVAGSQGIPAEERQALIDLYNSTDGNHWTHHVGWLGPPGTECEWHGVTCGDGVFSPLGSVSRLDLSENNLVGTISDSMGQLKHLGELWLYGNHISGTLPKSLIHPFQLGSLDVIGEASLLTDISEIDFESRASAVMCTSHRVILHSNGTAELFTERCRTAKPGDRTTFCEVKQGQTWWRDYVKLAWLLEKNNFFALEPNYDRSITHGTYESTRVVRTGEPYEVVNYADAGPAELWTIQRAIEGVAAFAEWDKNTQRSTCPRWNEAKASAKR